MILQQNKHIISSYVVGIPAYNEASTILKTLDSVLEASRHTEATLRRIIICINGCTDSTEELVRGWDKAPLTIISSEHGLIHAMNAIIDYATRHYGDDTFIKSDGDSIVDPMALKYLFAQLDEHPELLIAGGHPTPVISNTLSLRQKFISKVTSVRGRNPYAEIAVKNVERYHPYADGSPIPGLNAREKKLKIYFVLTTEQKYIFILITT
jgi:glycosyltransferase involved in cell wall biosynthesis